ncbi:MAG TPA: CBS domain-containing protein [Methanoculleus sp.]|uniref:CBS domain-containing protein n=1 Tax=Methanoculleus sp. TaxID=90427 RepID=UPI001B5587CC|nr:CBS domain-containing protein [Methanoculleus sp.]MBP7143619.1 CBS domain-containing protein [Methanoculleus sp.]HNT07891.1 CBS domain-containing protein [Methanoculleus sp.]HNV39852.1 CBS domain-containing protein [Methanoculleus sp.]HOF96045.1 CBS domain-containing protein [Methanoculleus sp.]HOS66572.1 CBS domain-containing protein [Methanoculleus sp.]
MQVKDIMTPDPVTVRVDSPIREAAGLLRKYHIGGLPVMDGDRVAGIVTETDIISLLDTGSLSSDLWLPSPLEVIEVPVREFINWEKTKRALTDIGDREVRRVMSSPAVTIDEESDIADAASLMLRERIARLPVIRNGKLIGIVTRADIVRGIGEGEGA